MQSVHLEVRAQAGELDPAGPTQGYPLPHQAPLAEVKEGQTHHLDSHIKVRILGIECVYTYVCV
jgi:hypothetical protein